MSDCLSYVYVLVCPTTQRVRYVGMTTRNKPEYRFKDHMWSRQPSGVSEWCFSLKAKGLEPVFKIVFTSPDGSKARRAEHRYIRLWSRHHEDLFNIASNPRYHRDPITRKYVKTP